MGKHKIFFGVLCLVLLFANCTYAQKSFITDKTVAALQFRVDKIFNMFLDGMIRDANSYSQQSEEAKQKLREGLQYFAMMGVAVDLNNPQSFSVEVENWRKNGFFIPNGSLQISVNSDLSLNCKMPVKIDLARFMKFINEKVPNTKDSFVKVNDKLYNIKGLEGHEVKMDESGFYITPLKPLQTSEPAKSWATMNKYVEDPESNLALEISVKDLHKSVYEAPAERLTFISFLRNALDNLSYIQRVRVNFKKDKFIAIAAYSDENKKSEHKEQLSQMIPAMIEQIKQKSPYHGLEDTINIQVVNKKQWIGLEGTGEVTVLAATGGLAGLVGMAVYSIQQPMAQAQGEQAKQKACFSNQRVIQGATEMYCMYHEGDQSNLKIEDLVANNYLKFVPQCPAGGKYEYKCDLSKDFPTMCSLHGNPANPSVYNAGSSQGSQAVSPASGGSPVAKQKACQANIRIIQCAIELYNLDNSDMMIDGMNKRQSSMALEHLVEEGYMKSIPICPVTGVASYYGIGDLTKDGEICCEYHGTISSPTPLE